VVIALKGPLEAPKRSVDVAALASWLALRAVELQSKKLDVLEGREPVAVPTPNAATPNSMPIGPAVPAAEGAALALPSPNSSPAETGSAKPVHAAPRVSTTTSKPKAAPVEQLQLLPPPIDIRPLPRPARPQSGPAGAPGAARQPPPKPLTPPAPRPLSEILFGN
jgi:large subunit ribosomal protein L24